MKSEEMNTYVLDHVVQTFTIQVRSLTGVSQSQIKNLIEEKYEVIDIEQTESKTIGIQCIN